MISLDVRPPTQYYDIYSTVRTSLRMGYATEIDTGSGDLLSSSGIRFYEKNNPNCNFIPSLAIQFCSLWTPMMLHITPTPTNHYLSYLAIMIVHTIRWIPLQMRHLSVLFFLLCAVKTPPANERRTYRGTFPSCLIHHHQSCALSYRSLHSTAYRSRLALFGWKQLGS